MMLVYVSSFGVQSSMSSALTCMTYDSLNSNLTISGFGLNTTLSNNTESLGWEEDVEPWKFAWSSSEQAWAVTFFFMGSYIILFPTTIWLSRFSLRNTLLLSQLMLALTQLLAIPAAKMGLTWLYIDRFLAGLMVGVEAPCGLGIIGRWAPPLERSLLFGLSGIGCELGNVFSYAISTVSCSSDIQGGWPFVFYITGGFLLVASTLIFLFVSDDPKDNARIRSEEKLYILSCSNNSKEVCIPLWTMVRSLSVWGNVSSRMGFDFLFFFMITQMPLFLRDVLKFSPYLVSFVTGIPFLTVIPSVYFGGVVSELLVTKGMLSINGVRKLDDAIAKFLPGVLLIVMGFLPEASVTAAFVLVSLTASTIGFGYLSSSANMADLSSNQVGPLFSFVSICDMWVSFVIPIAIEGMTSQKTRAEWQNVMYMTAGVGLVTFFFYAVFASSDEIQPLGGKGVQQKTDKSDKEQLPGQDDYTWNTTNFNVDEKTSLIRPTIK